VTRFSQNHFLVISWINFFSSRPRSSLNYSGHFRNLRLTNDCLIEIAVALSLKVSPLDWLRVFWTLKNHFTKVFVESFKTLFTAASSCGADYQRELGQLVYVLEIRPSNIAGQTRLDRQLVGFGWLK